MRCVAASTGRPGEVDLGGLEAGELDLEAELDELVEGAPERVAVPAGLLGQAVLGDGEGLALRLAESPSLNAAEMGVGWPDARGEH